MPRFQQFDCFALVKPIPDDDSIATGTIGVVLEVFDGPRCAYEVEFPDGVGGNQGNQLTYTLTEEFMRAEPAESPP